MKSLEPVSRLAALSPGRRWMSNWTVSTWCGERRRWVRGRATTWGERREVVEAASVAGGGGVPLSSPSGYLLLLDLETFPFSVILSLFSLIHVLSHAAPRTTRVGRHVYEFPSPPAGRQVLRLTTADPQRCFATRAVVAQPPAARCALFRPSPRPPRWLPVERPHCSSSPCRVALEPLHARPPGRPSSLQSARP